MPYWGGATYAGHTFKSWCFLDIGRNDQWPMYHYWTIGCTARKSGWRGFVCYGVVPGSSWPSFYLVRWITGPSAVIYRYYVFLMLWRERNTPYGLVESDSPSHLSAWSNWHCWNLNHLLSNNGIQVFHMFLNNGTSGLIIAKAWGQWHKTQQWSMMRSLKGWAKTQQWTQIRLGQQRFTWCGVKNTSKENYSCF